MQGRAQFFYKAKSILVHATNNKGLAKEVDCFRFGMVNNTAKHIGICSLKNRLDYALRAHMSLNICVKKFKASWRRGNVRKD